MNQISYARTVKSYVIRSGRITPRQKMAFDQYWSQYGLKLEDGPVDLEAIFQRKAPTILEIGFGMGKSLIEIAQKNPHVNYLGIEVHPPGVGAVLANIAELGLTNIRIYAEDACEVLTQCISDNALQSVLIFFPDPWPKKRHHKRRIIQPHFIDLLGKKLKLGGSVHLATDIENYAEHVITVFSQCSGFVNQFGNLRFAPDRPSERPLTKFELRGNKLGNSIWDIIFVKTDEE